MTSNKICSIDGCVKQASYKGYCGAHYTVHRNENNPKKCKIDGCTRGVHGKGYCSPHYWSLKRHGNPLISPTRPKPDGCSVQGCNNVHEGLGYCRKHYSRYKRYGDPLADPPKNRRWGTGTRNTDGYIVKNINGVRIMEHRLVMQKHIGRPLTKNELVHHKNGIRHDNRIDNLELCINQQPPGRRVSDTIEWCTQFLSEYAPEKLNPQSQEPAIDVPPTTRGI